MSVNFLLRASESAEIFSPIKGDFIVLYRFRIDRFAGAELKIVREGEDNILISKTTRTASIDVAVKGPLFIEAIGDGAISGTYEVIGFS